MKNENQKGTENSKVKNQNSKVKMKNENKMKTERKKVNSNQKEQETENKKVNKTVQLDLLKTDGNAFSIMGAFRRQAEKEGWTKEEIDRVLTEAQSKDYNHLLATIMEHCE